MFVVPTSRVPVGLPKSPPIAGLLIFFAIGCGSSSHGPGDAGADGDADADSDADADGDSDADADADADADGDADGPPPTAAECFADIMGDEPGPDYDRFGPILGHHCSGTNHQAIEGVERVVFLGDSITEGTPPTAFVQYYRNVLADRLRERFGELVVDNCSDWGARTDDLLLPSRDQIHQCFNEVQQERTLVVMTVGGNDISAIAQDALAGTPQEGSFAAVDDALALLRDAVEWLTDPAHFPNGSWVVMANVYEFTDGTGDLPSCPGAGLAGFDEPWPEGRLVFLRLNEGIMQIAVDTGTDMIFMAEHFCGHGFHAGEPDNQCFRGEDAETWFDLTCIHPNPTGHAQIAGMFDDVVGE